MQSPDNMLKNVRRSSVIGAVIVVSMTIIEEGGVSLIFLPSIGPLMAIAASPFAMPFFASKKVKSQRILTRLLWINLIMIGGYLFLFHETYVVRGHPEAIFYLGFPIIYFVVFGPLILILRGMD